MKNLQKNLQAIEGVDDFNTQIVLKYFALISAIDHASKRERALADFIVQTAVIFGRRWQRDEHNNVVVYVEPEVADAESEGVCLQAHIDMVAVGTDGKDFDTSSLEFMLKDGKLSANNTSLGADNGIGVAIMLSNIEYGSYLGATLELLFTSDEETGLNGASAVNPDWIQSKKLINLDSEELNEIVIGCAGGVCWNISVPSKRVQGAGAGELFEFTLGISGLSGGHSGVEIHEEKGNAIVLTAQVVAGLMERFPSLKLVSLNGGERMNIIPQKCEAILVCDNTDGALRSEISIAFFETKKFLLNSIPAEKNCDFYISEAKIESLPMYFTREFSGRFLDGLISMPNGVIERDPEDQKFLKTSSNLAIVQTLENGFEVTILYRSSSRNALDELRRTTTEIFSAFPGALLNIDTEFQPWTPKHDYDLLQKTKDVFMNKDLKFEIKISHGGLEPGCLEAKLSNLQAVSIGPTIKHPHSQSEYVEISSIESICNVVDAILETS
ncbi:MAG: beta-Ala-His dipeptidase [Patescibacteria group bacterium]